MYLIVGLGNPGKEYEITRHNMGFNVIDKFTKDCDIVIAQSKFKGIYGTGTINGEKVIILKPQTYMNLSGESVVAFRNFYKIENKNILVIYDDMDLEEVKIRIRKKWSAGTHNGMKSVINCLGTEEFPRIMVGIGKPKENEDIIKYVIGPTTKETREKLQDGINLAAKATLEVIKNGVDIAMNKYNWKDFLNC